MWLQRFTDYILRHRFQALAFTFVLTCTHVLGMVGFLLASFGILIAAFVTLVKGPAEGAAFTIAATLPYVISFYFIGSHDATPLIYAWYGISLAVLSSALTWVFAVMLYRQASFSSILQVAALIGVLAISVIHLIYPNIAEWWGLQLTQTQAYSAQALSTYGLAVPKDLEAEAITTSKLYATGSMTVLILIIAIFQLIVARWWQSVVFSPGSLRKELQNIRLSQLAGILFVLSIVLYYWGNSVVLDIMPILFILFGAAGLSLIQYASGLIHSPNAWFWLLILYLVLFISLPFSIVLVAIFALLDIWLDVRKRVKKA